MTTTNYDLVLNTEGINRHVRVTNVEEVVISDNALVFITEGHSARRPERIIGTRSLVSAQRVD